MGAALLEVEGLGIRFATDGGELAAVDGLDFSLSPGRTLAVVGESGCGKSATALALMGLLAPNARVSGSIRLAGRELLGLQPSALQAIRGAEMAMIFQEPMTSLNPAFTVGDQISEAILRHRPVSRAEARAQAIAMLDRVRIPAPALRHDEYPHKLSGGMRQRAMIAMALACGPKLLIADEPTTALDVTIQAQILELLRTLGRESGTAIILITHDLGVVAEMADEVLVMYAGRAAEHAPAGALFQAPQHPYTVGLLGAMPSLAGRRARLAAIEGMVPDLRAPPAGCRFASRCPFVLARCTEGAPDLVPIRPGHLVACYAAPLEQWIAAKGAA
ncbi:MAG: ABC transporter ATP-binding protein [Acetobacteraceae bacterium]|nr:ABC transporter ATP-binding protein [Acetobacteraceae bacterium]